MRPKVFIARPIAKEAEDYIAQYCDYRMWRERGAIPLQQLKEEIADVDGLLTFGGKVNDELLEHAANLKVVTNISVGYNNFDLEAMRRRKIWGTHTPSVLDDSVADMVIGLMLSAARRIPEMDRMVKAGGWVKGSDIPYYGVDVHHTTLGIIGMGRIGEAVAKRARFGFDMEVYYSNRNRKPEAEKELGVVYKELNNLLKSSDYIVMLTPLTAQTEHMIGAEQFAMMKKSAIFINISRGKTVDEQAMIKALQEGQIRAAGLDVFDREPVQADNPLLKLDNVVVTPHVGSATFRTRLDMAMMAARNLVAGASGEMPPNVVTELKQEWTK